MIKDFSKLIKETRLRKGWTRKELSQKTRGYASETTIKRLESSSDCNPRIETIKALQTALGLGQLTL